MLVMKGIHKRFPCAYALKEVDFDVRRGEVHALVGENGAGKSTLMHVLAGVHQQDSGTISFNGRPDTHIENERMAQDIGIGMVFQERSLVSTLNVAENIFAGRQPANKWGIINYRKLFGQTTTLLDTLGMMIDPRAEVGRLSPAQQQQVEIAKALSLNAQLLIFDEPTASLTETETAMLFDLIRELKRKGVGIIYISHRLEEIFEVADRVTVLKDGEYRGTFNVGEVTIDELISLMVGRDFLSDIVRKDDVLSGGNPVVLEVRHLTDHRVVKDVSFSIRGGEVTAFAGLAGSGRTELAMAIFGASGKVAGEVLLHGKPVRIGSPRDAIEAGLGYLPEDRKQAGLFLEMSVAGNVAAANLRAFGSLWMDDRQICEKARYYRELLRITCPSVKATVQNLSGGNQQKVVLARWLLLNPKVLIVDEPTVGIDIGAKREIHALLHKLARQGTAVVMISSELPEILAIADRIFVMREGRISGELSHTEATEEKILHYASVEVGDGP